VALLVRNRGADCEETPLQAASGREAKANGEWGAYSCTGECFQYNKIDLPLRMEIVAERWSFARTV
jgi:hypothetical protein